MKKYRFFVLIFCLFVNFRAMANQSPEYRITEKGGLSEVVFAGQAPLVFHTEGALSGPSMLLNGEALTLAGSNGKYSGVLKSLDYGLEYSTEDGQLVIKVKCHNSGTSDLNGLQFSLQLGLNTEMTSFPEWRTTYFPTLLRCEQTHFWGYLMNPNGNIVTLASPDPVASYRLAYNNYKFRPYEFGSGHLIQTLTLDLLNPQPLPEGHPRNADRLRKGETKSWTVYLGSVRELSDVIPAIAALTGAATVTADVYTVTESENVRLTVYSAEKPKITAFAPNGTRRQISLSKAGDGMYQAVFAPRSGKGVYRLTATVGGKTSEACISVRYPWSDYIASARRTALKYRQKASSHVESWYGFIPAAIAEEYFPDNELDGKVEDMYREVFPLMYDTVTHLPTSWHDRIQNHAIAASLYVQRYKAKKDENELRAAARSVDFLMTRQSADGAYRNGKTHYTSVIYIAKSIMEVMAEEKKLAAISAEWDANYRRHYYSVARAMDELAENRDNIQTEGELTFEDGMIACSYAQLSMFALMQPKGSTERNKYVEAAEYMYNSHRCLSQHLIPDSRVHGASIRFWESQYDILTCPNFINSPHGWSAWRIYGAKYLYEATGKEAYLFDIMSALGACVQLLDPSTDCLNWAFVGDPYVKVKYFVEDENNPGKGIRRDSIIGRQYLPMISDWYRAPANKWVTGFWGYDGGCCDNDVHEIFKCMGEIALTSACFHLRPDGTYIAWNCSARLSEEKWYVSPSELCVTTIYSNTDIQTDKNIFVKRI